MDCLASAVPRTAVHWKNDHWAEITHADRQNKKFGNSMDPMAWIRITEYLKGEESNRPHHSEDIVYSSSSAIDSHMFTSTLHAKSKIVLFFDPKSDNLYKQNNTQGKNGTGLVMSIANSCYLSNQLSKFLYDQIALPELAPEIQYNRMEPFFHKLRTMIDARPQQADEMHDAAKDLFPNITFHTADPRLYTLYMDYLHHNHLAVLLEDDTERRKSRQPVIFDKERPPPMKHAEAGQMDAKRTAKPGSGGRFKAFSTKRMKT